MTRDEHRQRTLDGTQRAQKEGSRVRQCFDQLGEWTCLQPRFHSGPHGHKGIIQWAQETKGAA